MKKTLYLALAAVLTLCSCVHQFPESVPATVDLRLTFYTEMPYYKTVMFPDETKSDAGLTSIDPNLFKPDFTGHEEYDLRYTVEAFRMLRDGSYSREAAARWVFSDEDASKLDDYSFSVSLDEGRYIFRAWADYVKAGTVRDLHWLTSTWKSGIRLNHADGYDGATDWRDAYVGSLEVDVIRYGSIQEPVSGVIQMRRPHGKYYFLTNDLDEFMTKVHAMKTQDDSSGAEDEPTKGPEFDITDYTFVVTYTSFVPDSYNIHTDRANDSAPTATFQSGLTQVDATRAIMGFDYVITGTSSGTSVRVGLTLKDKDGTVLAEHSNVNIPVNANQYTLVEGRFLMQESSGGVAIDPGFNGPDFVVPVN